MSELAIIYYSSNREEEAFEQRVIQSLLENCGGLPIISVTQRPIQLGKNICVGDVGASGFNMFRQILIGCVESDARFVISAEADSFYAPDYFTFIPDRDDTFYRSSNIFLMGRHRDYFYKKSHGSTFAQVVNRTHYIRRLEQLFTGAPQWSVDEKNFPKERWRKEDVWDKLTLVDSIRPCFQIKTGNSLRHYCTTREREIIRSLDYWGDSAELRRKYLCR